MPHTHARTHTFCQYIFATDTKPDYTRPFLFEQLPSYNVNIIKSHWKYEIITKCKISQISENLAPRAGRQGQFSSNMTTSCYCCDFVMFLDLELSLQRFHNFAIFFFICDSNVPESSTLAKLKKTGFKKSKKQLFLIVRPFKTSNDFRNRKPDPQNPKNGRIGN